MARGGLPTRSESKCGTSGRRRAEHGVRDIRLKAGLTQDLQREHLSFGDLDVHAQDTPGRHVLHAVRKEPLPGERAARNAIRIRRKRGDVGLLARPSQACRQKARGPSGLRAFHVDHGAVKPPALTT